jgi:hypothetical protein
MESTSKSPLTDLEWEAVKKSGLNFVTQGTNAFDAAMHEFAQTIREQAAAPELLAELQKAHQITQNALQIMTPQQKAEWARVNERDACIGEGTTRANEREAAIAKATGVQL